MRTMCAMIAGLVLSWHSTSESKKKRGRVAPFFHPKPPGATLSHLDINGYADIVGPLIAGVFDVVS